MINVVNKFKQIIAIIILVAMIIVSNGFSTLAASSAKVLSEGRETTSSVLLPKSKEAGTYYDKFGTSLFHYESKTLLYSAGIEDEEEAPDDNGTSDDTRRGERSSEPAGTNDDINAKDAEGGLDTNGDDFINDNENETNESGSASVSASEEEESDTASVSASEGEESGSASVRPYEEEEEEESLDTSDDIDEIDAEGGQGTSDSTNGDETLSTPLSSPSEADEASGDDDTNPSDIASPSEAEISTSSIIIEETNIDIANLNIKSTKSDMLFGAKASRSNLFGADPAHSHKICGIAEDATCEHSYIPAHNSAISYTKITTMKEMNEAFVAGGNYYLGADITYTSAINPSPNFSPARDLNICLNGFTLIRVTFKGSENIVNITNCAKAEFTLSDGTVEDAIGIMQNTRSTYFAEDININIFGVTVGGSSNLNIKYSLLYKGGDNAQSINIYNTSLTEGDSLNVNNYNYIHQVSTGSITFEKNMFANLTGLKSFIYSEAGSQSFAPTGSAGSASGGNNSGTASGGKIIFDNNTISNVETANNFIQLNSNELIFENTNTINNNTFGLNQNSSFIEMLYGSKINFDDNSTTTIESNTINGYGLIGFININNASFYLSETATLTLQQNFGTHNQSTTYVAWFKFTNIYLNANILGKINVTANNMQHDYTGYSDDNYIAIFYADNTIGLGPNAVINISGTNYIKNTSAANITSPTYNDCSLMSYLFNPLANWRTGGMEFDITNIEEYATMVYLRDNIGLFKNATAEKISPTAILTGTRTTGFTGNGLYNGVVMMQFDDTTIVDWTDTLYKTAFTCYVRANYTKSILYNSFVFDQTTGGPEPTRKCRIMQNNHVHKLCGVTGNCSHNLMPAHPAINNDTDRYVNIIEYLGPYSMTQGKYFLPMDFATPSVTTIFLTGDLYLCLNGHSVYNFNFITGDFSVYICNCTIENTKKSIISIDRNELSSSTYGLNSLGQIIPISYSDLGAVPYLGYGSVEIYSYQSSNENYINIVSDRIMFSNNPISHQSFFNVDIIKYTKEADTSSMQNILNADYLYLQNVNINNNEKIYQIFNIENVDDIKFSNINILNNKNITNKILGLKKATMSIVAQLTMTDNSYNFGSQLSNMIDITEGSLISVAANIVVTLTDNINLNPANSIIYVDSSKYSQLVTAAGSKLIITNNTLVKNVNYNTSFINIQRTENISLAGHLTLTDNKITGLTSTTDTSVNAAFYIKNDVYLNVGASQINIKNNTSDGDVKTNPAHHMYQLLSDNTDGFITQIGTTVIDAANSYMYTAFKTSPYTGIILKNYSSSAWTKAFQADYFIDSRLVVLLNADNDIVITFSDHTHKLCGITATMSCAHTLIDEHVSNYAYLSLPVVTTENPLSNVVNTLASGGQYRLEEDLEATAHTTISFTTRDLYLCLNGHSMTNFSFSSSTYTVYITNCQKTVSNLVHNVATSNKNQSLIYTNADVIGKNKNICIQTCNVTGRSAAVAGDVRKLNFYDVDIIATSSMAIPTLTAFDIIVDTGIENVNIENLNNTRIFYIEGRSIWFKDTNIKNNIFRNHMIYHNNSSSYTYFLGNCDISGNTTEEAAKNLIDLQGHVYLQNSIVNVHNNKTIGAGTMFLPGGSTSNGSFNIDEYSTLNIYDNINYRRSNVNFAFLILRCNNNNIYGNLNVINNKVYNSIENTNNSYIMAGIWFNATTAKVYLASGSFVVRDNVGYKDEGVTPSEDGVNLYSHMIQMYVNDAAALQGYFYVADGYIWDPRGSYMNVYISNTNGSSIIFRDFTINTVGYYYGIHKDIIVADTFNNPTNRSIISGYNVAIKTTDSEHIHKICGVSSTSECLHTEIAKHDKPMVFLPTSDIPVKNAYYLTNDISIGGNKPSYTLTDDLYLCLNGYNLTVRPSGDAKAAGFQFFKLAGYSLYVTNCQTDKTSTILASPWESSGYSPWGGDWFSLFTDGPLYTFGLNNNLTISTLRYYGWSNSSMNRVNAYGTYFQCFNWSGGNTNNEAPWHHLYDSVFESCRFYKRGVYRNYFRDLKGSFIVKNCSFDSVGNLFIHLTSNELNLYLKGDNYFYNCDSIIENNDNCPMNILIEDGTTVMDRGTMAINCGLKSTFTVSENAKLHIKNLIRSRGAADQYFVGFKNKDNINIFGDFIVEKCSYVECNEYNNTGFITAVYLGADTSIKLKSNSFIIRDIISDGNYQELRNHYPYKLYSDNTRNVFVGTYGEKFNTKDSYVTVAFPSPYTGIIMRNFTADYVDDPDNFASCFSIDTFNEPTLVVNKQRDIVRTTSLTGHTHKSCGLKADSDCRHSDQYNKKYEVLVYNPLTDLSTAVTSLNQGGNYYLDIDLDFAQPYPGLRINQDLFLCLNGHSIKNLHFDYRTAMIYICNCITDKTSQISYADTNNPIMDTNVSIYGNNKNIELCANKIFNSSTTPGYKSHFADMNIIPYDPTIVVESSSFSTRLFNANSGRIISFENTVIKDYQLNIPLITIENGGIVNFYGDSYIQNITMNNNYIINNNGKITIAGDGSQDSPDQVSATYISENLFSKLNIINNNINNINSIYYDQSNNLNIKQNASLSIKNNIIERLDNTDDQYIFSFTADEFNLLSGNITISSNSFINCNTAVSGSIAAAVVLNENQSINLGNTSINITDNIGDELNPDNDYKNIFNIYVKHGDGFLNQTTGQFRAFDTNADIAFGTSEHIGIIYKNWDETNVYEWSKNVHKVCFTANDFYFKSNPATSKAIVELTSDPNVILSIGSLEHGHKICGIDINEKCSHTKS